MAIVREFYVRDKEGERESFALARDVITDRVFILHAKGQSRPDLTYDEAKVSVGEFFRREGAEQTALLDLIGTLVVEA